MKFMLFVCTDSDGEPYDAKSDTIGEWVAEMTANGRRLDGQRLRPAQDATTVRVRNGKSLVTEGPLDGSKDAIAGFDIVECVDLAQAVETAAQHPMARFGRIEIRPFWPFV